MHIFVNFTILEYFFQTKVFISNLVVGFYMKTATIVVTLQKQISFEFVCDGNADYTNPI